MVNQWKARLMFTIGLLIYHTEVFCCHTNAQLFAEVVGIYHCSCIVYSKYSCYGSSIFCTIYSFCI